MIEVVIPAHNAEAFLRETLESVARQSRPPASVSVVNDRSRDGTRALAEALAAELAPRLAVRVMENAGPPGPSAARNTAIRASSQPFIAPLDADDLLLPDHHAVLAGLLEANPGTTLAFGDCSLFESGSGRVLEESHHGKSGIADLPAEPMAGGGAALGRGLFERLLRSGVFGTSACLFRRDAALSAGVFDETMMYSEDTDLFLRLNLLGPFVMARDHVSRKRVHGTNLTQEGNRPAFYRGIARSVAKLSGEAAAMQPWQREAVAARLPRSVELYLYEASRRGLLAYRDAARLAVQLGFGAKALQPRNLLRGLAASVRPFPARDAAPKPGPMAV